MGHRASYALVENKVPVFYYSHWGALSVPEQLLAGPEATVEYIRALAGRDSLLSTTWAEGGILVDLDTSTLIAFGGEDIQYTPYLRRVLLPLLRTIWSGWIVDWARFGIVDFAYHLGIDAASVLTSGKEGDAHYPSLEELRVAQPEYELHPITVKWSDGLIADYMLAYYTYATLMLGPKILPILQQRQPAAWAHERDDEADDMIVAAQDGVYVDIDDKMIWLWSCDELDPRWLDDIERAWPGWHAEGHIEGVVRQMQLSGRDPTPIMVPNAEAARELMSTLTLERSLDPASMLGVLLSAPPAGTDRIEIAPGFLRVDSPTETPAQRRALLEQLLRSVLGE